MALLNRKALLSKEDLRIEKVVLGKEDFVYVRQMTGREKDRFERSLYKPVFDKGGGLLRMEQSLEDFKAKLAVNTLCDANGELLLKPEDYTVLSQNMSAHKLEKIVESAQRMNAITDEDKEALVKNLEPGPAEDSHSGSAKS